MPVPKRRKSQARSRMQRAANMRIDFEAMPARCQSCGEPKAPHRICASCGKYGDKQIIPVVEK
jgi:large subunit ribosomal protein L32